MHSIFYSLYSFALSISKEESFGVVCLLLAAIDDTTNRSLLQKEFQHLRF